MFFFRRRRGHKLLHLLLIALGFGWLVRRRCPEDEGDRSEMREKARQFRGKLREAFAVWQDKETPEPATPDPEE